MISLNCPLVICRKKGEYIWMEIGGDFYFIYLFIILFFFFFFLFWSFRLYLGASHCTYFLAHDVVILMSLYFMSCI